MLPDTSTIKHVVFDGTTELLSFQDFVQQLERSPDWVDPTTSSMSKDIEHVIPGHLYGEALRYYESLDQDCQEDWPRLRDAMARRFPGGVRSGGIVRRSITEWDEDSLATLVDAPPLTSSKLAMPTARPQEDLSQNKKTFISLSILRDKLRLHLPSCPDPYVTVHSFFIEYIPDWKTWRPEHIIPKAKVDLNDSQALNSARKIPLVTIASSDSDRYRVGYVFTVHPEARHIAFCHNILTPKARGIDYTRFMGDYNISPMGQFSEAIYLTDFIKDRVSSTRDKRAPPGKYTIRSHLVSSRAGAWVAERREKLGDITWRMDVI